MLEADLFRVVVSAEDLSVPIELFFPGDSQGGEVEGVPVGRDRRVLVEAINSRGRVVRRREVRGVSVSRGRTTPVSAALLSVPLITNLSDGVAVTTTRLRIEGFGEPAGRLEVWDLNGGREEKLLASVIGAPYLSPSLSDGFFRFEPGVLEPGLHTFRVRATGTGETSEVTISLVPPGRMPGRVLASAGSVEARVDALPSVTLSGTAFARPGSDQASFPHVVDRIARSGGPL
jgi:hypothetical protein